MCAVLSYFGSTAAFKQLTIYKYDVNAFNIKTTANLFH